MMVLALALAIIFGLLAGVLAAYARRAGSQIPFGAPSPLIGKDLRQNQDAWEQTHRRAVPYLWSATAIALIQTAALAAATLIPSLLSLGYILTLTLVGVALIVGLLFLAGRP